MIAELDTRARAARHGDPLLPRACPGCGSTHPDQCCAGAHIHPTALPLPLNDAIDCCRDPFHRGKLATAVT